MGLIDLLAMGIIAGAIEKDGGDISEEKMRKLDDIIAKMGDAETEEEGEKLGEEYLNLLFGDSKQDFKKEFEESFEKAVEKNSGTDWNLIIGDLEKSMKDSEADSMMTRIRTKSHETITIHIEKDERFGDEI